MMLNASTSISLSITVSGSFSGTGSILREYWANLKDGPLSAIPVKTTPTTRTQLRSFEAPSNIGDKYGTRVSGYVCAPISGEYTFWIACDDQGELYLSTDSNPSNKRKIAYTPYMPSTNPQDWDRHPVQKSASD